MQKFQILLSSRVRKSKFFLFLPITRAIFSWFYLLPWGVIIPGLRWEFPPLSHFPCRFSLIWRTIGIKLVFFCVTVFSLEWRNDILGLVSVLLGARMSIWYLKVEIITAFSSDGQLFQVKHSKTGKNFKQEIWIIHKHGGSNLFQIKISMLNELKILQGYITSLQQISYW